MTTSDTRYELFAHDTGRVEIVAEAVHLAIQAHHRALGHHFLEAWVNAPAWQQETTRQAVLEVVSDFGELPEDLHARWASQKRALGWRWGPVQSAEAKTHPNLVPYNNLPTWARSKEVLFAAVVRAALEHTPQ